MIYQHVSTGLHLSPIIQLPVGFIPMMSRSFKLTTHDLVRPRKRSSEVSTFAQNVAVADTPVILQWTTQLEPPENPCARCSRMPYDARMLPACHPPSIPRSSQLQVPRYDTGTYVVTETLGAYSTAMHHNIPPWSSAL